MISLEPQCSVFSPVHGHNHSFYLKEWVWRLNELKFIKYLPHGKYSGSDSQVIPWFSDWRGQVLTTLGWKWVEVKGDVTLGVWLVMPSDIRTFRGIWGLGQVMSWPLRYCVWVKSRWNGQQRVGVGGCKNPFSFKQWNPKLAHLQGNWLPYVSLWVMGFWDPVAQWCHQGPRFFVSLFSWFH